MTNRRPTNIISPPAQLVSTQDKENQLPAHLAPLQKMRVRPPQQQQQQPQQQPPNTFTFTLLKPSKKSSQLNTSSSNLLSNPLYYHEIKALQASHSTDKTTSKSFSSIYQHQQHLQQHQYQQQSNDRSFVRYPKPMSEGTQTCIQSKGSSSATTSRQNYTHMMNRNRVKNAQQPQTLESQTEINDLKQLQYFLLANELEQEGQEQSNSSPSLSTTRRPLQTNIESNNNNSNEQLQVEINQATTTPSYQQNIFSFRDDHLISKQSAKNIPTQQAAPPISMSRIANRNNPSKLSMHILNETEMYTQITAPLTSTNSTSCALTRKTSIIPDEIPFTPSEPMLTSPSNRIPFTNELLAKTIMQQKQDSIDLQRQSLTQPINQSGSATASQQLPLKYLISFKKESMTASKYYRVRKQNKNNFTSNNSYRELISEEERQQNLLLQLKPDNPQLNEQQFSSKEGLRSKSRCKAITNQMQQNATVTTTCNSKTPQTNSSNITSKTRTLHDILEKSIRRVAAPLEISNCVTQKQTERHQFNKRVQTALIQFKELQKHSFSNLNNTNILDPQFNTSIPSVRNNNSSTLLQNVSQNLSNEKLLFDIIEQKNVLYTSASHETRGQLPQLKILPTPYNSQALSQQFNSRSRRSLTYQCQNSNSNSGF